MQCFKKVVRSLLLLSLAACASDNAIAPPDAAAGSPLRPKPNIVAPPSIADPDQGLKSAIDAYRAGNNETALVTARIIAEQYSATPWYKRSLFLSLQALIQMDRASDADAVMLQLKTEYPEMADYAVSILADYHYSKARFTQAAVLYQNLMEQYPKSSLAVRAFFRRGQCLLEASAFGPAADVLEAFLEENQTSEFGPEAALALGRALTSDRRPDDAVRAHRRVWVHYPGTPVESHALKALADLSSSGVKVTPWTGEELFTRGKNLFRTGQYDRTLEALGKLLEKYPKTAHRSEALFRIGVAHYNLGKRGDAVVVLERLVRDYPRDPRVPEALYWMGRSQNKLGDSERGIKTLRKVFETHPGSEWADDAIFLIGNIYRESNDMKKGLTFYRKLARDYPDSRFADSALWWNAWSYYRAGEYRNAEQTLQELINRYPRSFLVYQAYYWLGRIAEKTGNPERAAALFRKLLNHGPYTYYGHRASERLADLGLPETVLIRDEAVKLAAFCSEEPCLEESLPYEENDAGPPVWTEETRRLLAAEASFGKTLELMHLDMKKEAAAELWYLQDRLSHKRGTLIGLSKAFFELGDYYRSLILVLRNYERYLDGRARETPADLWVLAYPQGYWDTVLSYSRKYGQDPYFIAAIIREESQFHPSALSRAGARGVMQVMPATGEWIAQTLRMPGFDRAKLFEHDTAIHFGTWYVSRLMKRFKGDPLFVAAGYNAGPAAVSGWISRSGGSIERDEFVEAIPYAETRNYVKKVLRNYAEYKRIYGKTIPPFPRFFDNAGAASGPLISGNEVLQ